MGRKPKAAPEGSGDAPVPVFEELSSVYPGDDLGEIPIPFYRGRNGPPPFVPGNMLTGPFYPSPTSGRQVPLQAHPRRLRGALRRAAGRVRPRAG